MLDLNLYGRGTRPRGWQLRNRASGESSQVLKAFREGGVTKDLGRSKTWWRLQEPEEPRQKPTLRVGKEARRLAVNVALCTPSGKADVTDAREFLTVLH